MRIVATEFQPDFPLTDISDKNAAALEELLTDPEFIGYIHTNSERLSLLYRLSHLAGTALASKKVDSSTQREAFLHGTTLYETIGGLVQKDFRSTVHNSQITKDYFYDSSEPTLSFISLLSDAREEFDDALPRTKKVIATVALKSHGTLLVDYTVSGAALSRYNEVDLTARSLMADL